VRPVDPQKIEDHSLRILQLQERAAVRLLNGFDPEDSVQPRRICVTYYKRDVSDVSAGRWNADRGAGRGGIGRSSYIYQVRRNYEYDGLNDVLSQDRRLKNDVWDFAQQAVGFPAAVAGS